MSNFVNLLDIMYPVGSVYITTSTSSPADVVGGTWERVEGHFLRGMKDGDTPLGTGGADEHFHDIGLLMPEYNGWGNISANDKGSWFPDAGIFDLSHKYDTSRMTNSNVANKFYYINRFYQYDNSNNAANYVNTSVMSRASVTTTYTIYQMGSTSTDSTLPSYINVYIYYRIA